MHENISLMLGDIQQAQITID